MTQTRIFKGHEMVRQAEARIRSYIRETPVEHVPDLETGEGRVWLKLENNQVTGSFKVRGAVNRLLTLTDTERSEGIIASSAGNHGLGVAFAAETFTIPTTIFAPQTIDEARKRSLERFPAEVRLVGDEYGQAEAYARDLAKKTGKTFVSPYNDPEVIAGQGTIGAELLRQIPEVETVFVSVGGGGLVAGVAAYLKAMKPTIEIVGVAPSNSPAMFDILAGTPEEFTIISDTVSDSTAGTIEVGSITIDLCRALINHWVLLDEGEIVAAMKYLFYEHRIVSEGAGALTLAAYVKEQEAFKDKHCALLVCGGNIDPKRFLRLMTNPSGAGQT